MKQETILSGKWQFIGAEKYIDSKWQPSESYVKGMVWELFPQYFSEDKIIGNIAETTPLNTPITMAYLYIKSERVLKVDISTDCAIDKNDMSEVDTYSVIFIDDISTDTPTIKLSILAEQNGTHPYFQYILRKLIDL